MPEAVLTPAGVKAVDARLERAGLLDLSMEEAGRAGANTVQAHYPLGRVLLLAGGGANGGDALVTARHLHALGREVKVLAQPGRHALTKMNRRRLRAVGVPIAVLNMKTLRRALPGCAVVVDGLLGTGFTPPLRPALLELVQTVNDAALPVVSLDIPTGLDATSSEASDCLHAAHTVTFSGLKPALLYGPAARHAGQLHLATLRSPPGWAIQEAVALRPTDPEIAALLPVRPLDAHKGTAGHVWVVGGKVGTLGAALLAGRSALRGGAGLVSVHSGAALPLLTPELMLHHHADLLGFLQGVPQRPQAVALGMGLGPDSAELARAVLAWHLPSVLDADALQPELSGQGHELTLWTPHPGEAARMLQVGTPDITRDPIQAARALQERYGGTVILKGGPTTVAAQTGVFISRGGHPGMAKAGMGDTLAGLLAALLGQGLNPLHAALAGVRLHALAGELAGAHHGYGLSATDVMDGMGSAWQRLLNARDVTQHYFPLD